MSTSAVSSASLSQQLEQYFQTRRGDLQQLGQALAQGNLSGAQTAFNNIVTLGQSGPSSSGAPFLNSTREQDFTAIGQALQNGDLAGAQQAFATLRNSALNEPQQAGSPSPAVGPEPAIVVNLSGGSSSSPEQITINLSPSSGSGGGEQVTIGVGSQGSAPSQEITLNLGANSNEEIVLNLLGNTSSATSTTGGSNGVNVSA